MLLEQLGKPDIASAHLSQSEKSALKHCSFYGLELCSAASKSAMQVVVEDVRSLLSLLVAANALEAAMQLNSH